MQGSIKQRSKGSWRLRYDGPPDPSGRRKQVSETVRGTRKDAEAVLRERLQAVEGGSYVAKSQETVGEFLDRWLDTYAATNTSPSTQRGYAATIRRYLKPELGHLPLQGLPGGRIQALYAALLERGLSPTTVVHAHRVLSEALSYGVKWGLLANNAALAATPPRIRRKEVEMWGSETINRFLRLAKDSAYVDFYHLAVLTGMRRSELAGLHWEDVDLSGATLHVVRTLQRINGKGLVVGQTKTAKGRRSIALSPDTVDLLHAIRGRQLEGRLIAGEAWVDMGYVFTQADGKPLHPDKVSNEFHSIVVKAGLPQLTLHGLRHAHATLMLGAGVNPKVVSERLGHASVAITLDIYSHVLPGIQAAAVLAVDEQLARHETG